MYGPAVKGVEDVAAESMDGIFKGVSDCGKYTALPEKHRLGQMWAEVGGNCVFDAQTRMDKPANRWLNL